MLAAKWASWQAAWNARATTRESSQADELPWAQIVSDLDLAHSWICPEDIGKEFEVIWGKYGKEITAKLLKQESSQPDDYTGAANYIAQLTGNTSHKSCITHAERIHGLLPMRESGSGE